MKDTNEALSGRENIFSPIESFGSYAAVAISATCHGHNAVVAAAPLSKINAIDVQTMAAALVQDLGATSCSRSCKWSDHQCSI